MTDIKLNYENKKTVFWRRFIVSMEVMIIGYGSNDNRVRIWERVEWMICHSDYKYLHQRLLPAIINFLSLSDEDSCHHLQ